MAGALRIALLCSLLILPAPQARAVDGAGLLSRIQEDWTSRESFSAKFVQWQTFSGFDEPLESRGRMRILRPSYFEIVFDPPVKQLQVCDGNAVWTYTESTRQVIKVPLAPEATRGVDLLDWALAGATPVEAVADTAFGERCERLRLAPGEHLPLSSLTLWSKSDGRLLGYEATDTEGNRTRMRFLEIRPVRDLKPADFRYEPPAGVEVIEMGISR